MRTSSVANVETPELFEIVTLSGRSTVPVNTELPLTLKSFKISNPYAVETPLFASLLNVIPR